VSGNYFKNIYKDYETVGLETLTDMRKHKLRSTVYLSALGGSLYLMSTNPSEQAFYTQLTENTNDLLMVGDPIRNIHSDTTMQSLTRYLNQRRLRRFTFGVCSVMWIDNYDPCVDLYEAQCKHLKVGWLEWKDKIVDVGVAGRWRGLDRAMIDYDINMEEWRTTTEGVKPT